jgi:phage terminase Nu1 subunit (DNA packaging protein)
MAESLRGRKNASVEEGSGDTYLVYQEARAKREVHNANLAELDEAFRKGELVESESVKRDADFAARTVRDAFLALPDRLSSLLVGRTEKQINQEIRKEIRTTLEQISRTINE